MITGPFTQGDPIGLAGGVNQYGYVGGDPVNHSDPFGLTPALVCGIPVLLPACWATASLIGGALATTGVAVGLWLSGRHRQAVDRVETDLSIAGEHIDAAAGGPDNGDEDPNWVKDKLDDAQKHLNNARKHVEKAVGRTRRELERRIDEAQRQVDRLRKP